MKVAWRQNVIIEGRPLLTACRAGMWLGHCILRIPASIDIDQGGPRMRLKPYLYRYGSTSLYMKRIEFEPALVVLSALVRHGDTILDVGANFGVYSLLLAKRAGRAGRCYAFEPGAEALAQLRHNLMRNPELQIEIVPMALSDSEGVASLFHTGGPTTFNVAAGDSHDRETIATTTLDAWSARSQLERIDVMKIDVEGHETSVFLGGRSTLSTHRPIIMFEVSRNALQRGGRTFESSWNSLAEIGYQMYRLHEQQLLPLLAPEEGNLFAVHPEAGNADRVAIYLQA